MNYELKYNHYLDYFNKSYNELISSLDKNAPSVIKDAMIYATDGGGKKVRPVLCYATCELLGLALDEVKEFALAIEFIHSYSLVHDDLPCMDNDDYRRGKLSTHKKFGYAFGVLAGDALLNFAFEICLSKQNFNSFDAKAMKILAEYAGYSGMIGGQVLDLQNEKNFAVNKDTLYEIYINKTSKLITAPLLIASEISGGKYFEQLKDFGFNLGVLFQITDDILDEESSLTQLGKTPHKDKDSDKLTSIKLFGLDGAKAKANEHYQICKAILNEISGSEFLCEFLDKIYYRNR